MTRPQIAELVDAVIASHPFGRAAAAKRGRHPQWPWVPIIDFGKQQFGVHRTRTEQLRGRAFESRASALMYASETIIARKARLRLKLLDPCQRALREQHGLPRELAP